MTPRFDQDDETLIRSALRDIDVDRLRQDGFVRLDLPEDLRPYANGGFATSDGRALIRNDALPSIGMPVLPEYEVALERARHRFSLMTPKTQARFLNSSYSHVHGHLERAPVLEMAPDDLAGLGIAEGDRVRVSNDRGTLILTAAVSHRVRPGVVAIPWGWWGSDLNVNALTGADDVDAGGGVAFYDARVDVEAITVP